jgi:CRISPR-associated protein Csd1
MTQPVSSPLPALISYYKRLESDPNQMVASFGFSLEKIHFQVVLEADGTLSDLVDVREKSDRGKPIPRSMLVPDRGGRSGTGLKPFFCWDNTGYALGRDNKGKPERAEEVFAAFRDLHLSFRDELRDDEAFAAFCRFLEKWNPINAESLPNWSEAIGLNIVFKLRGQAAFVHQSDAVEKAWSRRLAADDDGVKSGVRGLSLLSGEREEIARLHDPLISGVSGANTMGAAIVSFNASSFESYGKSQSYNAPVGANDVFQYTTALNRLLGDGARRVSIGDATVVFWSDRAEAADAEAIAQQLFIEPVLKDKDAAEHGKTISRLSEFLKAARQGRLAEQVGDPEAPFYILGLSPNVSRLSVRFWQAGTVRQFAEHLARHASDLKMTGARPGDPPLVIRGLVSEIMPPRMASESQKKYAAQLAGEITRAVLGGFPYPQALLNAIVRRIRGDSTVNHRRAAIIKAYLTRNRGKEVPVALNKDHPDEAYQLGRLFAALEKTQEDATEGNLNSTIKDRYFGAASATPASVFPMLMRLHQHHMNKIENKGFRVSREKLIGEICGRISRFPAHLSLEKQGLFHIAYYHQRQDHFTKKAENGKETTDE